jgi:hypothetical protein
MHALEHELLASVAAAGRLLPVPPLGERGCGAARPQARAPTHGQHPRREPRRTEGSPTGLVERQLIRGAAASQQARLYWTDHRRLAGGLLVSREAALRAAKTPHYANAAVALAREAQIPQAQIDAALQGVSPRTRDNRNRVRAEATDRGRCSRVLLLGGKRAHPQHTD